MQQLDKLKALFGFYSKWDLLIFLFAILVSISLFLNKCLSLMLILEHPSDMDGVFPVYLVNLLPYLAICSWVLILLVGRSNWVSRVYVLLVGLLLASLVKTIEFGEFSTRQGVDYSLVKHLVLLLTGRNGVNEYLVDWFFQFGIFLLLVSGIFLKLAISGRELNILSLSKRSYTYILVFSLALLLSFAAPATERIPESLKLNGLVYVVKTAISPVKDIRPVSPSVFRFDQVEAQADFLTRKSNHESTSQYFSVAKGKNIVVIALESTGANMLDFYPGSDAFPEVTPFMSSLSEKSLIVNRVSSVMNSTSKSLVSILCGIEPYPKTEVFEVTLGVPIKCLPERLSETGYHTSFFQSATLHYEARDQLADKTGFDEFFSLEDIPENELVGKQKIGPFGFEDKVLLGEHSRWLKARAKQEKPLFTFYMTLVPHHPYLPVGHSESFKRRVEDNHYLNNYLNALSYIDQFVEAVFDQYKDAGISEDTVFIIIGDHGEGFGRYHRPWFHNNLMYHEASWVPFMMINEQLFPEKKIWSGNYSLMDLAPSLEHLLGMDIPESYRGFQIFTGNKNRMLFSACWYSNRCISVSDSHYRYIYNYEDSNEELYDLKNDFREQDNIALQNPAITSFYRQAVFGWYHDVMSGYEAFFEEVDPAYLETPESYYQFPAEVMPKRVEVKKW